MLTDVVPLLNAAQDDAMAIAWNPWRWINAPLREEVHEAVMKVLREREADKIAIANLRNVKEHLKLELKRVKDAIEDAHEAMQQMVERLKSSLA